MCNNCAGDGVFDCMDCGIDTSKGNEYYMVNDDLWDSHTKDTGGIGMLCIGCLETRIGRQLVRSDFTDAPVNWLFELFPKSDRFMSRQSS